MAELVGLNSSWREKRERRVGEDGRKEEGKMERILGMEVKMVGRRKIKWDNAVMVILKCVLGFLRARPNQIEHN